MSIIFCTETLLVEGRGREIVPFKYPLAWGMVLTSVFFRITCVKIGQILSNIEIE